MNRTALTLAAAALIATGSAFAQQSQPSQPAPAAQTTPNKPAPTVNQRRENQQDRIANGVQSGQLTAGETKNVEGREANLNREIKDDRSADNGKLTNQERQQVNRQQNNLSRSIYTDKHNTATAHYGNNEIGHASRKSAGPHRERDSQRADDCRRSGADREPRTGHQSAGSCRSRGQRRASDRPGKGAAQPAPEWLEQADLPAEAQRENRSPIDFPSCKTALYSGRDRRLAVSSLLFAALHCTVGLRRRFASCADLLDLCLARVCLKPCADGLSE